MAKVVCPAGDRHIADTRLRSFDRGLEPAASQYARNQANAAVAPTVSACNSGANSLIQTERTFQQSALLMLYFK